MQNGEKTSVRNLFIFILSRKEGMVICRNAILVSLPEENKTPVGLSRQCDSTTKLNTVYSKSVSMCEKTLVIGSN